MRNATEAQTTYLAHFRMNGVQSKSGRGVEQIMSWQIGALNSLGMPTRILTGETDSTSLIRDRVVVIPEMRMEPDPPPKREGVRLLIEAATEANPIIFHNTTRPMHNIPYCQAAADIVDASTREERQTSVLWVHDIDSKSSLREVHSVLPSVAGSRIAVISNTRLTKIEGLFTLFREQGLKLPEYDMRVIPNPIDEQFFRPTTDIPRSFFSLAPHFQTVTDLFKLPQTPQLAEDIIFNDQFRTKFLLPGVVAHNKGTIEAIKFVQEFSERYNPAALIISNFIENNESRNTNYANTVIQMLQDLYQSSSRRRCEVIILGGVDRKYMKWLYEQSDLLLTPYQKEGFGLPPLEAGSSGLATALSDDPALLESTGGYGLVIPHDDWQDSKQMAGVVYNYMQSSQPMQDVFSLAERTRDLYHPDRIRYKVLDVVTP